MKTNIQKKIEFAKEYAAKSRERNNLGCQCEACVMKRIESDVIRMINNWRIS